MTTLSTKKNATSTLSYHSSIGFVHVIPRPSLKLGRVADGKVLDVKTSETRTAEDLVLFRPYKPSVAVFIQLGCGAILKFSYSDFVYMPGEGGRCAVELDRCELVDSLPVEVEPVDLYPALKPFEF